MESPAPQQHNRPAMYTPDLMPRNFHHLWLGDRPAVKNVEQQPPSAPPLSSYSSMRPGSCFDGTDEIQQTIGERSKQLKAIRTLGYEYLTPLGVGKTMQMIQEDIEMRRQMEEQMQQEVPTAENLLGEVDQEQLEHQVQVGVAEEEEPGTPVEPDMDGDIPEAEEANYDEYDEDEGTTFERQYDRAFMVTEQYQAPAEQVEHVEEPQGAHFVTPTRDEVQANRFHSGSTPVTTHLSDSSFDAGNVSVNGSDLDMTIDE